MLALVDSGTPGANNHSQAWTKSESSSTTTGFPNNASCTPISGTWINATILTNYLDELDIDIDKRLATALLYGIRIDTHDYKKHVTRQISLPQ